MFIKSVTFSKASIELPLESKFKYLILNKENNLLVSLNSKISSIIIHIIINTKSFIILQQSYEI